MRVKKVLERRLNRRRGARGWTLIELLIVVAVSSLVLAIAAMSIGGVLSRSSEVVAKRNAQHIVTVAAVVAASGSTAVAEASGLEEAIDRLVEGVQARYIDGAYQVASLSEEAKQAAMAYLRFEDGRLRFRAGAGA